MCPRVLPLLGLLALVACKSGPEVKPSAPPEFVSQELSVAEQGLTDFRLRFSGVVSSKEPAVLEKATYELVVEEKVVKSGQQPLGKEIAAGGQAPFELEEASRYVASAEELSAMSERGGSLLSAIRGTLFVRQGTTVHELPFARSKEIRVPRLPTVTLHELDAARYAADEASATFFIGVVNPNPFPIKLNGLKYAVEIAGKSITDGVRGAGEKVATASTGVFEVQLAVNKDTHGAEIAKLIKSLSLPYAIKGEVAGELFQVPYELTGIIKLNVSK